MMNLNRKILAVGFILLAINCMAQKATKLKPTHWISTKVPEPSDLCFDSKSGNFFVVSDDGILFETDREGKIIRKVKENDTKCIFLRKKVGRQTTEKETMPLAQF